MNRSQQKASGVGEHAMREMEIAPGDGVRVGGVDLTVASVGSPTDADAVVLELRTTKPGCKLIEGDDGVVLTVPSN